MRLVERRKGAISLEFRADLSETGFLDRGLDATQAFPISAHGAPKTDQTSPRAKRGPLLHVNV